MERFTANYSNTDSNFVIQNLDSEKIKSELIPILYVIKNIIQRGNPSSMSAYLKSVLGDNQRDDDFPKYMPLISDEITIWHNTIKGDKQSNYYPARHFYEEILTKELGEFSFIQQLIIPEIEINEIVNFENETFIHQQVDFYLPQAKLVIEIDGQQHKYDEEQRVSDTERDRYLNQNGITTIRITTQELKNNSYSSKLNKIINHLKEHHEILREYQVSQINFKSKSLSDNQIQNRLLPTAIIRFQILILELLINNKLKLNKKWVLNILIHEKIGNFCEIAINDLLIWISALWQLKQKTKLIQPTFQVSINYDKKKFIYNPDAINVDFSILKRYTDESEISPSTIFVRTDYMIDRTYFKVSTAEPINYKITDSDRPQLEFFLQNIFGKPVFRDGQFPIIANALNRKDTIGLLPTGGGKSLCYQLPCLLQPSINFVVCPIKSLMYDQFANLKSISISNVGFITSDIEPNERRRVELDFEKGKYLFVWISPEKFQIPSFRETISSICANFSIAYAVVDEVHCLSEWGHDFRISYLNLAKTIDKLSPKDINGEGKIKFLGLTATASVYVLKDIKIEFSRRKLRLEDENIKSLLDYSRKELQFEVIYDNGRKREVLRNLIERLRNEEGFIDQTTKSGLIFTPNVNGDFGCYILFIYLNIFFENKVNWYSGEVPKKDEYDANGGKTGRKIPIMNNNDFIDHKKNIQQGFKEDNYPLLVSTKAFGMGIDKSNIFYTIHYGLPSSVESLYQEAGRAGRWDKNLVGNNELIAKCYVLHSEETVDPNLVERLFQKDTSFSELNNLSKSVGWNGKDIFRNIFLFIQGQKDINEEFQIIRGVLNSYYIPNSKVILYWENVKQNLNINNDVLQKAIYRLSLLGIVEDWTTDFIRQYEVRFNTIEDSHIINCISKYINKYEPNLDVGKEIELVVKENILEKSIFYLLNWTFENIAYNRKQSLKTISDWCIDFRNGNNETFKRRIDSYFTFSEQTFILQHISENPNDYQKWFESFYLIVTERGQIISKIHIPEIENNESKNIEYSKLRDSISRFLESNRNNIGLNFVSGFVRLAIDDYSDTDGKERFESALDSIKRNFNQKDANDFLERLINLGVNLIENQKKELTLSITKYFPERIEQIANVYKMDYLLNDVYSQKLLEFKKLNLKLYEQLREIQ